MPYITPRQRNEIDECLNERGCINSIDITSIGDIAQDPGKLNYIISNIIKSYMENKGISYSTYNEVIGVLECAKLELYRHHIGPYEQSKIEENGDL